LNRNRVYRFPEEGIRVEGDGNRTGAEVSNCKGDGIRVDPGAAAEVFDVVDGQRSLVDGREGKMMIGLGLLPRLRRQVEASDDGLFMM
jgi:hypothetical protein